MRQYPNGVWNEGTCELLRRCWEDQGLTCGQIVLEFGRVGVAVTRNSIISKVHRLKLIAPKDKGDKLRQRSSGNMKAINVGRTREPTKQAFIMGKKYNPRKPMEIKVSLANQSGSKAVLLKHSKEGQCKAIIGYVAGRAENAVYCGEDTVFTSRGNPSSWCRYHQSIYITEPRGKS